MQQFQIQIPEVNIQSAASSSTKKTKLLIIWSKYRDVSWKESGRVIKLENIQQWQTFECFDSCLDFYQAQTTFQRF